MHPALALLCTLVVCVTVRGKNFVHTYYLQAEKFLTFQGPCLTAKILSCEKSVLRIYSDSYSYNGEVSSATKQ